MAQENVFSAVPASVVNANPEFHSITQFAPETHQWEDSRSPRTPIAVPVQPHRAQVPHLVEVSSSGDDSEAEFNQLPNVSTHSGFEHARDSCAYHYRQPPPVPTSPFASQETHAPRPRANPYTVYNSVLTMPMPGSKQAPEKFRGEFHKVCDFLQHYECLCIQHNVTLDSEKCETLLRYCSRKERQTIMNIEGYLGRNWGQLVKQILNLYDADLDTKRYHVKDVRNFIQKYKDRKIKDLASWKKYCRCFIRIAGSLLADEKISRKEYMTYFWRGIPKALHSHIEARIIAQDPNQNLSIPFRSDEIDNAALALLQRDRFDQAYKDSDSDGSDSSAEEESSGEDSGSSESDSDTDSKKKRRERRRLESSKKRVRVKRTSLEHPEGPKYPQQNKRTVNAP